ncbi:acyl-CoA thioesterase [Neobacillus pocheonensis]|uniref:Acyl-CoA thioesterase n=1 Tax=Neobacillus pocheonensis TaxID=363869 RepID=A0ABT0WD80_9BACI|nr:acyl-CoA thioesterase [Neobacillus pocheonensis]
MFNTTIKPRVSETDGMGHINNTVVTVWFEAGREEIFKIFTPNLSFDDWKCVVVNLNIDYLNEIFFGSEVEVKTWIKEVRNSSFIVEEELYQKGALCAKGTATYVNFNGTTRKAEPIPEGIRYELEQHYRLNKRV